MKRLSIAATGKTGSIFLQAQDEIDVAGPFPLTIPKTAENVSEIKPLVREDWFGRLRTGLKPIEPNTQR